MKTKPIYSLIIILIFMFIMGACTSSSVEAPDFQEAAQPGDVLDAPLTPVASITSTPETNLEQVTTERIKNLKIMIHRRPHKLLQKNCSLR